VIREKNPEISRSFFKISEARSPAACPVGSGPETERWRRRWGTSERRRPDIDVDLGRKMMMGQEKGEEEKGRQKEYLFFMHCLKCPRE
jgi:hypothetical protein